MNNVVNPRALLRTVERAYLEIFPVKGIERRLEMLPAGSYVAITCSPAKGVEATLDLVERLSRRHLRLVPHVAARQVRDEMHLRDILAFLAEHEVDSVFVPGGDARKPIGPYDCALQLLRAMAEIGHEIPLVGVAAHPEGHPNIDGETLLAALKDKQEFANYLVTQICFDASIVVDWLREIRRRGIHLSAWIGLPGVVERTKLFTTALRIGVGQSVRFAMHQNQMVSKLLRSSKYRPDDLLTGLAPYLDDVECDIPGFHLFSFNQVESTERWRADTIHALSSSAA
ncbi:MAG: methylenetetrahydrofolate reductase [Proteobacteria bacterium]|nr:methylenetetrahydrofolate reductase [Pseudomonadota bacterium]